MFTAFWISTEEYEFTARYKTCTTYFFTSQFLMSYMNMLKNRLMTKICKPLYVKRNQRYF